MKNIVFFALYCIIILSSCNNKIEINILGEESSNLHALQTLEKEYEEKEDSVSLEFRPNSFSNAIAKANLDFQNKKKCRYDIVMQYNFSLSSYMENNYVYTLDSLLTMIGQEADTTLENDIFPAWEEVGWYYDKKYGKDLEHKIKIGYPFALNTMLLVYNKDMFEDTRNKEEFKKRFHKELLVPTDWETYAQIAEFFTNNTFQTYGVCMQGHKDSWLYYEYCDFLYGMGGCIYNKKYGWESDINKEIKIDSDAAVEATKLYLKMKKFNKGSYFNVSATEQVKLMKEGNVAMALVWSDYLFGFLDEKRADGSDRFGFAVLPGSHSPIAGGCFYVNRRSEHPDEAMKFILYVMQPENQVKLALQGLCSPLISTYDDENVKNKITYSDALAESLHRGKYMYEANLESQLVSDIVTKYIQMLWEDKRDELDVKETLYRLKKELEWERKKLYNNR